MKTIKIIIVIIFSIVCFIAYFCFLLPMGDLDDVILVSCIGGMITTILFADCILGDSHGGGGGGCECCGTPGCF